MAWNAKNNTKLPATWLLEICAYFWDGSAIRTPRSESGPLLETLLAVLGCFGVLCWRSWAALRAYVGGLGPLWRLSWSALERYKLSWAAMKAV
jgi:hypothetical protein